MEKEIQLSSLALKKIIEEDASFKEAVKQVVEQEGAEIAVASNISALVGCELRHHYLLTYLIKGLDLKEEKYLVLILLANHFFLKRFDSKESLKLLKEVPEKINEYLTFEGSAIELVSKDFKEDSLELISMRFNVPTYLLKMWFKHYGKSLTFKTLKKNIKPAEAYYALVDTKISKEEFEKQYPDFEKTEISNVYHALKKNSVHKLDCYKNFQIYSIRLALKAILDKIDYSNVEEMTLYSGEDESLLRDLFYKSNRKIGIHVAVPSSERADILRLIRVERAKNINHFEIKDFENLPAHISEKQDLVVVFPKSSSFDKISKYPDYLLHFKQDSLDELIANQKEVLKGMSTLVAEEGKLVYIVDTLNRKESVSIINDFITNNKDFTLVSHEQIFPHNKLDGAFYYAILEKKEND